MENKSDHTRTEKIERIKKALADGTYQILPTEIVRTIIDPKRDLNSTGKVENNLGSQGARAVVFGGHKSASRRAAVGRTTIICREWQAAVSE
jgi:hypothetical protein